MNNAVTIEELGAIIGEFFEDPQLKVNRHTQAKDVDGWDSLAHLDLIATLEEKYSVRFRLSDITNAQNVGDLLDMLNKLVARKG